MIQTLGPEMSPEDPRYPYPTSYISLKDSHSHDFVYVRSMPSTLVFFGTEGTTAICIKFVRRYSSKAHSFCASRGFAPQLKGFDKLPGGWYMAVMEDISEAYRQAESAADLEGCCDDIVKKLGEFHQHHHVHGDIRNTNVMVRKDGEAGFMLVDFDWAGENGKVLYPSNVNVTEVKRPVGAVDGKLITVEHDMEMLGYLLGTHDCR